MEPFLGEIMIVGFNFAPRGWALCEGQILPINQNQSLYSLLGTQFGGDGRTTFALPDLRGRSVRNRGNGAGVNNVNIGQKGGANTLTMNIGQMTNHTHPIAVSNASGEESVAGGNHIANHAGSFNEDATAGNTLAAPASVGGGQSFSIDNPYLGLYVCIALQGLFPSRN